MKSRFRGHDPEDYVPRFDRGVSDVVDDGLETAEQHRVLDTHNPESHRLQGDEGPIHDHGLFSSDSEAVSIEPRRVLDSHNPESHRLQGDEGPIHDHGLPFSGKER